MSNLLLKPAAERGRIHQVTPKSAGWTYVGFEVHRLAAGETAAATTGEREACLVLVAGKARVEVDGKSFGALGGRHVALRGQAVRRSTCRRARPGASRRRPRSSSPSAPRPGGGAHAARLIAAGHDRAARRAATAPTPATSSNILPETEPARQPAGGRGDHAARPLVELSAAQARPRRSAGRDRYLEETYYHRLDPPQGFAFQRVYTDDRSLDETMAVEDGDVVLVPRGYHPVRRAARLRPLLPERHGRADAGSGASATTRRTSGW